LHAGLDLCKCVLQQMKRVINKGPLPYQYMKVVLCVSTIFYIDRRIDRHCDGILPQFMLKHDMAIVCC